MKSKLKGNAKYPLIVRELRRLYGREKAAKLAERAEEIYLQLEMQCTGAGKGEWEHLHGTILPAAAFYRALQEQDPASALQCTREVIVGLCEKARRMLNVVLKLPLMKGLFMRLLPKMALRMFGRSCGFDYEGLMIDDGLLTMNMTLCPYCKYAKVLGCPELIPVFCESDFATYGNLDGILFTRSQTLGTGGKMCDFRFERMK